MLHEHVHGFLLDKGASLYSLHVVNIHKRSNDFERAMALSGLIDAAYRAVVFLNV